jgi:hypothetical protein
MTATVNIISLFMFTLLVGSMAFSHLVIPRPGPK